MQNLENFIKVAERDLNKDIELIKGKVEDTLIVNDYTLELDSTITNFAIMIYIGEDTFDYEFDINSFEDLKNNTDYQEEFEDYEDAIDFQFEANQEVKDDIEYIKKALDI